MPPPLRRVGDDTIAVTDEDVRMPRI